MQHFWNEKFSQSGLLYGTEPNLFIKQNYQFLPISGNVICLGEGEGRNAIFLAQQGFKVEALDASDVALKKLRARLDDGLLNIMLRHTMIENWQPQFEYDGVVCVHMHLPKEYRKILFEKIIKALKTGGIFLCEVFSKRQLKYQSGGPKEENMLYDLCETYDLISNFDFDILKLSEEIVSLDEGVHQGEACVVRMVLKKI